MYKILGSDGKEYGPITLVQVNQWIAEKRLEKKTPVFPENGKDWAFLGDLPEFAAAFAPPPVLSAAIPPLPSNAAKPTDGGLNKIIPYKNVSALMAYYFGVFSVLPLIGIILGLSAVVLGVLGLRYRRANPTAGGSVHAWIGIIVGGFFGLIWLAMLVLMIVMPIMARHHR